MSQIISVDFKNKIKIQDYIVKRWMCLICKENYEDDSRTKNTFGRILVTNETRQHPEQCVCEGCAIIISGLTKKEGWLNGKS